MIVRICGALCLEENAYNATTEICWERRKKITCIIKTMHGEILPMPEPVSDKDRQRFLEKEGVVLDADVFVGSLHVPLLYIETPQIIFVVSNEPDPSLDSGGRYFSKLLTAIIVDNYTKLIMRAIGNRYSAVDVKVKETLSRGYRILTLKDSTTIGFGEPEKQKVIAWLESQQCTE